MKKKSSSSNKKAANAASLPQNTFRSLSELVSTAAKLTAEAAESEYTAENDVIDKQKNQDANKNDENKNNNTEIETDLEFTCMTNDEYEETMKLVTSLGMIAVTEEEDDKKVNDENSQDNKADTNPNKIKSQKKGNDTNDNDDDDEDENGSWNSDAEYNTDPNKSDNDDDDSILGFFSTQLDDDDEEPEPEERPFLKLWGALSSWVTPGSVTLLEEWKNEFLEFSEEEESKEQQQQQYDLQNSTKTTLRLPFDTSDVGASRCAGLMSMMKLNLPKCISELILLYDSNNIIEKGYIQRCAEERLSNLLRTFDYAKAMVKLDGKLWKVLTFVLLEIVFLPRCFWMGASSSSLVRSDDGGGGKEKNDLKLPMTVESIGMTLEEYRYLTKSALTSLSLGSGE